MKRISLALALMMLFTIGIVSTAPAVLVDFTVTADNLLAAYYKDGGLSPAYQEVTLSGGNFGDWQNPDTVQIDLDICHPYEIIFHAVNSDTVNPPQNNPGAFLGQISGVSLGSDSSDPFSNATWYVGLVPDDLDATPEDVEVGDWLEATEYGYNGGANIWTNVNGGAVGGISTEAQWIWTAANFDDPGAPDANDSVFIKAEVHAVPEPGTLFLLGSGLAGLAGYGLRRRKRK